MIAYHETGDLFADTCEIVGAHKVLRMQPSIQFWFKETGCWENELLYAKYSILHGHEQLFASKYKTCLPSEEQFREEIEIEIQKRFYYLQKEENKDF